MSGESFILHFAGAGGGLQDTTLDEPVMDTIKRDINKVTSHQT
jgi:hypothetical protein